MNALKVILLTVSFYIILLSTSAQTVKGTIEGTIKGADGAAIEFASIRVHRLPDSTAIAGTLSDTSGYFILENISYGNYFLLISTIGHIDHYSQPFTLSKENNRSVHDAVIHVDETAEEIVIQAQAPFIRQEAGITVVNVEAGILNAGMSAAEVLKRTPGATVDKDGIVKLKGKGGVLVLIDGKPLYMDEAQIGALLKSIPADQIKEIEVITSPSAKYDAAGNAGIVNIKLKKGAYEGLNGTVNTSVSHGVYPKANAGVNLAYKKKNLTVSAGYQYNYRKNLQRSYVNRAYTTHNDSSYYTSSDYAYPENAQSALLNGSYDISPKGTLLWDGNVMYETSIRNGSSKSKLYSPTGALSSSFLTSDHSTSSYSNLNTSLGYKQLLDTIGTELFVQAEYKSAASHSNQQFTTNYFDGAANQTDPATSYQSVIPVSVHQWGAKADFTKTLPLKIKMESGLKLMYIQTNTNVTNSFAPKNYFTYQEQIQAAYVMLNKKINRWKLSGGLSAEHTANKGVQKSIDSTFERNYTNLFPSATISYLHSEKTEYSILYSKRIQRPSYHDLNPFVYYNDPYNSYAGNPYLLPEYTHQAELTASKFHGALLTTLNYSYTTQPQSNVWIINPSTLTTTYTVRNLISQQNIGLSLSVNTNIGRWWTMNNYLYVYNNTLKGDVGYGMTTVSRPAWILNATHTFKLPHSLSAELSFNYESPNYFGTILYREVWQLSAGLQKKIMQENLSLKLSVTDIFWKYVYVGEGTFGDTKTTDGYKWDNRVLMFSLSYRFGKRIAAMNTKSADNIPATGGSRNR